MSIRSSIHWAPAAIAAALLFAAGCGPTAEEERAVREGQKSESEQREALRQALGGATEESFAVKLVQSTPAVQGGGTTEQWIQRQAGTNGASIFFPRWEAERRGMGKYEVIYTCTLMQEDGRVGKWGVAWLVDIVMKVASSPREMKQSELSARSARYFRDRRRGLPPETLNVE